MTLVVGSRFVVAAAVAASALAFAAPVIAAPPGADAIEPPPEPPVPLPAATPRPWLYQSDPSAPVPFHAVATLGLGYASIDRGAERPFAADVAHAGAVYGADVEVGLHRFTSIEGQVLLAGGGLTSGLAAGGLLGVTFYPLGGRGPFDLSLTAGYLRELGGDDGAWGRIAIAKSIGRFRLVATGVGEHLFDPKRDPIDLMLTTGASVALTRWAGLGVEYVVQDLEEAGGDANEIDGGVRHFVGPTANLLLANRVQFLGGPAFGLSQGSPAVLGRFAASTWF